MPKYLLDFLRDELVILCLGILLSLLFSFLPFLLFADILLDFFLFSLKVLVYNPLLFGLVFDIHDLYAGIFDGGDETSGFRLLDEGLTVRGYFFLFLTSLF